MAKVEKPVGTVVKVSEPKQTGPMYHNSSTLVWPTDMWGITKDFKAAVLKMASKINGHSDKKALFDETLDIALKHIEAKFKMQAALNESRRETKEDDQ